MQLPVLQHDTTAEKAFGAASALVENVGDGSGAVSDIIGTPFQVAVLFIGLVYLFFIVRYWDFLRFFIITAAGFHTPNREKSHINPAEQKNIEVVMIILGVILTALSIVKICGFVYPQVLNGIEPKDAIWVVGGGVTVALSLMIGIQYGMIMLIAAICDRLDIGIGLIETKLIYLAVGFVTVIPFGILFLLSPILPATIGFWGMIFCGVTALIIFVKETFFFFVSQKISILHWILYLCALEIFPLSLLLSPIMR